MALLATKNLSVSIGGKEVCHDISITFEANQVWAILGSNGAGKTTLLHTLAGLRPADSGEVELCGKPLAELKRREIAQQLGVLFQQQDEPFPSSVMETALIGRHPFLEGWRGETREDEAIAEEALKAVELENFRDRFSASLSGGEKQRLKIATLLTQNPQIMLLDEPTNHLDLNHQIKLLKLLTEFGQKKQGVMLMVLHDLNLATRFCTHAMLIQPNRKPILGSLEEVLTPEHLEEAYGWPVDRFELGEQAFYLPR